MSTWPKSSSRVSVVPVLVLVAVCLLGVVAATVAQGTVAGLDRFLVRPPNLVIQPVMTPARLALMREVPTYRRLRGVPSVKYSYGEFLLQDRASLPGQGTPSDNAWIISLDAHFVSVKPEELDWNDFTNCLYLMTPVKDQGGRGTCHIHGATALVEALVKQRSLSSGEPVSVAGQTVHITEDVDLSEQWLFYRLLRNNYEKRGAVKSGESGDAAEDLKIVQEFGDVPGVFWRYNPNRWERPAGPLPPGESENVWDWKLAAQTRDGDPRFEATDAISRRDRDPSKLEDFKIKNIVNAHAHVDGVNYINGRLSAGVPVVAAVAWPTGRMVANGCLLYVPDAVRDKSEAWCAADTETVGGKVQSKWIPAQHVVLICGVGKPGTPAAGLYAFKNSWSCSYGKNGYGFITEAYLKKFLDQTVCAELDSH